MGVTHKLRPEVINFILDIKRNNPTISCRNLTNQVLEKLQVKISKSSINAIFKNNNLSMPIGRRQKLKKRKFNIPELPVIEESKIITSIPIIPKQPPQVIAAITQDQRLKEAEAWAMKLQEEERLRLEQERQLRIQAQKIVATKKPEDELLKLQQLETSSNQEQEELLLQTQQKAEAERIRLEQEEITRQENARQAQEEAQQQIENEIRIREAKRVKLLQAQRLEAEQIRQKLEQEKNIAAQEEEKLTATPNQISGNFIQNSDSKKLDALPLDRISSGAIFLKALDCLVGATRQINTIIGQKIDRSAQEILSLTEAMIFRPLFTKDNLQGLWALVGKTHTPEELDNYCALIQQSKVLQTDIIKIIANAFIEARGIKVDFADGKVLYLDSQLHSTWSTPYIPYDFSSTIAEIENGLQQCCFASYPNVLFCAPGYNEPTEDFLDLLFHTGVSTIGPEHVTLYNNELKEISGFELPRANNYCLLFGLWPWQFPNYRKVKKIGEFNLTHLDGIDRDLYLAEIEIDFFQKSQNRSITYKGCAVKNTLQEKICVVILYSERDALSLAQLAEFYFSRWPNLEEAFGDFSKKIELFTYIGDSGAPTSTQGEMFNKLESSRDLKEITLNYLKMLDNYLRRYFLPAEYLKKDITFTNEYFYKLLIQLNETPEKITARIKIDQDYPYLKDLEYLLYRFSERKLNLNNGKLLWFKSIVK